MQQLETGKACKRRPFLVLGSSFNCEIELARASRRLGIGLPAGSAFPSVKAAPRSGPAQRAARWRGRAAVPRKQPTLTLP